MEGLSEVYCNWLQNHYDWCIQLPSGKMPASYAEVNADTKSFNKRAQMKYQSVKRHFVGLLKDYQLQVALIAPMSVTTLINAPFIVYRNLSSMF